MKLTTLQVAGVALAAALASTLTADIRVNKYFSVNGYVAGSIQMEKDNFSGDNNYSDSSMDIDAALLGVTAEYEQVSGVINVFTFGGTSDETGFGMNPVILDAYASYNFGNGIVLTAGNFKSSMGYEPFHVVDRSTINFGSSRSGGLIPLYGTGGRVTVTGEHITGGVAIKDSIYNDEYYKGDGDLNDGAGFEAFVKYYIDAFTIYLGCAYDDQEIDEIFTGDIWAQYIFNKKTTVAAEYCYGEYDVSNENSYFWLVSCDHNFGSWSLCGMISRGKCYGDLSLDDGPLGTLRKNSTAFTIAPKWVVTENLEFVGEYSYIKSSYHETEVDVPDMTSHYVGVQFRYRH